MITLAALRTVRRHILDALRGTLRCFKCGERVRGIPYGEAGGSYHEFSCSCGALWWAPFGWDYVRMLIESQMKEGADARL